MKHHKIFILSIAFALATSVSAKAQFGSFGKKLLDKGTEMVSGGGLNKILKQPQAITTSFKDVDKKGSKPPSFTEGQTPQPLYLLPKAPDGGFKLCAGFYEMINKSYCLHAGTRGPSSGDGYMLAPVLGPKSEVVILILKHAEKHPEVKQHDIQILLWAIIARTKFADMGTDLKLTATTLLSAQELLMLEGGALGVLPQSVMIKAKDQLPSAVQAVFEAENNIRRLASSGSSSYEEMEKYAIIAGIAPQPDPEVPSGIWSLHPQGYYVRYFPSGYSVTRVQVYVPKELIDKGTDLVYDATKGIACPANVGSQRLAQTNEPLNPDYTKKLTIICK
ncbi:hypothetical protein FPZ43_10175 [Mucilaginibacter pallidiroseus]|uniref:Uncharacterized protein n=1 Tax=Mucilaginibacter pallidiroseus TaxID=2599295 RepID=A0A563UD81_9SPHI|nr:hypothetical protein [Mucilaginibacter pallidiroseus]TWR29315.1 hypothetical protein FPZ43_10175 [Mucilaginibacter pallidiroseus]